MPDEQQISMNQSCIFIIFGGTGDLTHRKLLPALYKLQKHELLPDNFAVVSVGRRDKTDEGYREEAVASIQGSRKDASEEAVDPDILNRLIQRIYYRRVNFDDDHTAYRALQTCLEQLDRQYKTNGSRLFFLAVAPEYFGVIVTRLKERGMLNNRHGWQRVMIEKPFGSNLKTARELNRTITDALPESHIFRIDHYLGKEMIQNIMALRFGNSLFEPLWNHHYIDNIQITSNEMLGVESRGGYYEKAGICRDMLQNHLLQMLALVAMEPPVNLEPESIRDEKVKVLRALRPFNVDSAKQDIIRGQYGPGLRAGQPVPGYRDEERVDQNSMTDTFIALKAHVDNFRWAGVPFYIRAGKRMNRRVTQIVIEFKKLPGIEFFDNFKNQNPNLLVVEIQPNEGLFFQINAKKPGNELIMERIDLNYTQSSWVQTNSPEAYERLILEALRDNKSLFTRWDELEHSWQFVDSIENSFKHFTPDFPNYTAGSQGPMAALDLLRRDGRRWWEI
ncbi:MAG: glucose-6-phosphate dehydrogenase [Saccharofermentanales bacterium]|jgi:glucose-6-phosphate 1-dehydrogenase